MVVEGDLGFSLIGRRDDFSRYLTMSYKAKVGGLCALQRLVMGVFSYYSHYAGQVSIIIIVREVGGYSIFAGRDHFYDY